MNWVDFIDCCFALSDLTFFVHFYKEFLLFKDIFSMHACACALSARVQMPTAVREETGSQGLQLKVLSCGSIK